MDGLKSIAQSTFDKHQRFRPGAGTGTSEGAYRYNVIEIGAFGGASASTSTAAKRQSIGSVQSSASGTRQGGSSAKISLNEWMVFEDDLGSFMKKRPIDLVPAPSGSGFGGELEKSKSVAPSNTTTSTAASKTASMPSSRMTANTMTTATTATSTGTSTADRPKRESYRAKGEEIEAVASLKLVCIPRADVDDAGHPDSSSNTLAIARETFLRLYVDHMDADHCALYYLAREYDGYHEFTDTPRGVVTKFVGTSDYALIWTFNRRTLETRGLFLDRCQRWRSSDSGAQAATHTNNNDSGPVTPVRKQFAQNDAGSPATPSKKWARKQTGSVSASEAWSGFRETLNTYRRYIFAPQVLSFVCCVQMLRSFDEQANEDDLPRLKEVEMGIAAEQGQTGGQGVSRAGGSTMLPTQNSSFAIVTDQNLFGPSTPPRDDEKLVIPSSKLPADLARDKLISQSLIVSRVDTSLADKLRHLKIARNILEVIARETETSTVDVVAPIFLDRYHWAMEGMNEAVPALERHISTLEEYLRFLKGRSERLSGLVRSLTLAATLAAASVVSQAASSDALSLRCNAGGADSRSDHDFVAPSPQPPGLGRSPIARPDPGGANGNGPLAPAVVSAFIDAERARARAAGDRRRALELAEVIESRGFYDGYLVRGNYSHRLV